MLLEANGPFDLTHTLESGQAFRWRRDGDAYRGVVDGALFVARQADGGVEFASYPRPAGETAPRLRSYLRLDDDLPAFYRRWRRDRRLSKSIRAYPGLRLVRQDPWECLVTFVISIYSNIPRIRGHIEEISRLYGDPIRAGDGVDYAFPSPARLAEVGEREFRELRLGFRSRFLARLARETLDLGIDLASLRGRSYAEARETLLQLYGVGEKVVDCVLAFSLDKPEAFPVDVWVRRAVQEWYFSGEKVTDRAVRLWAAGYFGPDAAYAQQYLFHQRRLLGRTRR